MTARQAPQPLTVPQLLETLAALGAPAQVPEHLAEPDAVLHLSHGRVGAAERKAMEAELALRANGADSPEIIPAIEEAYAAANAHSRLDVLAHVQWRATRLVQALQALINDLGRADEVLSTAMMAAAGVSGLLSAQATMAHGDRAGAVLTLQKGVQALQVAAERAKRLP
ncbi:MAG: hypothetical protein ABIZ05_14135 [Pseudonocardiaceae bacterium]